MRVYVNIFTSNGIHLSTEAQFRHRQIGRCHSKLENDSVREFAGTFASTGENVIFCRTQDEEN